MLDFFKKGFSLGLGLAVVSKEQVEKFVDEMVKKGEVSQEESKEMIDRLVQKGEEQQQELKQMIREQSKQVLHEWNIATQEDVQRLENQIRLLQERLQQLENKQA